MLRYAVADADDDRADDWTGDDWDADVWESAFAIEPDSRDDPADEPDDSADEPDTEVP